MVRNAAADFACRRADDATLPLPLAANDRADVKTVLREIRKELADLRELLRKIRPS